MAREIAIDQTAQVPLDVAFAYVADYRTIPEWTIGVRRLQPVGELDYGLGSVFDAVLQLGVPIELRMRTVVFEENRAIGMDSVKGIKARSRWYFEADGPRRTRIRAAVSYELPFGPAGRVMGRLMEPVVRQAVQHISVHLRENLERRAG